MPVCPICSGDKIERCDNPDHGFIAALSFHDIGRVGCPVCGTDPLHRVRHWRDGQWHWLRCEHCDNDGMVSDENHKLLTKLKEA